MDSPKGYFKFFTLKDVPVYIHWSFPSGGLILAFYAGFDLYKVVYYTFAYVFLIAVHEIGHMLVARLHELKVYSIQITGVGGECMIQQLLKIRDVFLVYSAGVVAEAIVLLLTVFYVKIFGMPTTVFGKSVVHTFTFVNAIMIVLSLIPYRNEKGRFNDGYALWSAVLDSFKQRPEKLAKIGVISPVFPPETSLFSMDEFKDEDFCVGVEILNDNTTPMELVVEVLMKYFNVERDGAINYMLTIHNRGGMLFPTETIEQAEAISQGISAEVAAKNHRLTCRAVSR